MNVTPLPSAVSPAGAPWQFLTSYLINDTLAVDAGGLGLYGSPVDQSRLRHVFITHSHIDHVASLPVLVENAFDGKADCVTIHGSAPVLESLQKDIFNQRVWPDFVALSEGDARFLRLSPLEAGRTVELDGLKVTPVPVNHVVPTFGFIVDDGSAAVVFPSDTGPTDEIWQRANRNARLEAVFLEATFPDAMADLARVSKHLTPALFARELRKLDRPIRVIAVHLKPRFREQVIAELQSLRLPNVEIGEPGRVYRFGSDA